MRSIFRIELASGAGAFVSGLAHKYAALAGIETGDMMHPVKMPSPTLDGRLEAEWHDKMAEVDGAVSIYTEHVDNWRFAFPSLERLVHWFADENARLTLHQSHHAHFRELEIPEFACVVSPNQVIYDRRQIVAQHDLCPKTLQRLNARPLAVKKSTFGVEPAPVSC